jgi:hypothetical protein
MQKYYKTAAVARRIVTQHNTPRYHGDWIYTPQSEWACCSYQDYEGILMGLRGDKFRMWQWVKNNPTS